MELILCQANATGEDPIGGLFGSPAQESPHWGHSMQVHRLNDLLRRLEITDSEWASIDAA